MNDFADGPLTLDEMMKIVSLMENPPEAAAIRKALRHYEIPEGLEYKWGNNEECMNILSHFANPQSKYEVEKLCKLADGKSSFLEIGSSFGGTLKKVSARLAQGAKVVAVDLDCDNTPKNLNPKASLIATCKSIAERGTTVYLIAADSHLRDTVEETRKLGPFDLVFIDGDHSYNGMKLDWENYGPMGKVVAFHDIAGPLEECRRCWKEIVETCGYRTEQFIDPDNPGAFGIGVVYRE